MRFYTLLISLCILSIGSVYSASDSHIFVLVHGAWHGDWTFYKLKYELEKADQTVICVNLPGHGIDSTNPGDVTLADYQNAIVSVLDTASEPVVLVGHSMGGIAISMAAESRPEKIDKLVYLAAFMPQNGESLMDLAMQDSESLINSSTIIDTVNNVVDIKRTGIADLFYDSSTAEYVLLSQMLVTPNPLLPLVTGVTLTEGNYGSVRRFYITTAYDKAITPDFQQIMYTNQTCEDVYSLNAEHSPFFSATVNLKNILIKIGDDDKYTTDSTIEEDSFNKSVSSTSVLKAYKLNTGIARIEYSQLIKQCELTIASTDGRILSTLSLTPHSETIDIPTHHIKEAVVILLLTINGDFYSRKLKLY